MKILIFLFSFITMNFASEFITIPGWQPEGGVLQYSPGNLWEHINGAADQFIDFGFEELRTADVRSGEVLVSIEIYNMGQPVNAFGIYIIERPKDATQLKIGSEAVINMPAQALMFKNHHYIKLHVLEGKLDSTGWKRILEKIAVNIPGDNKFPEVLGLLPKKNMVSNSNGYVRRNFLGLNELNACIFAEYSDPKIGTYVQFVVLEPSDIINGLSDKWINTDDVHIRKIPYQGFIGIKSENGRIIGAAKVQDQDQILDILRSQ